MNRKTNILIGCLLGLLSMMLTACNDNDTFTTSPGYLLQMPQDTLSLDTVFSTVPSPHKTFVIHNNSGEGIRIATTKLQKGTQSGFRVNVNGTFLSNSTAHLIKDMEVRNGDSIRIFVEMTAPLQGDNVPRLVEDNLVFTLQSGVQQKVALKAYSWDAVLMKDVTYTEDATLSNPDGKPVVVMGNITVAEGATLTIEPGTTLYFHNKAGIDVFGTLKAKGEKDKEITFRCDRLDRMVSNLTYDNNPGQWGGIRFRSGSFGNEIDFADIHAAHNAILCDISTDVTRQSLFLNHSTIHNVKGNALAATGCRLNIENTQITNAVDSCLYLLGGDVTITHCTIAQYFAIEQRGKNCFVFANAQDGIAYPLKLLVRNSIIKGYDDDNLLWSYGGRNDDMDVTFENCLLRAVLPTDRDSNFFKDCIFEDVANEATLPNNFFELFDTQYFFYNFKPKAGTQAIGTANPSYALPDDRLGNPRTPDKPTMGCFE